MAYTEQIYRLLNKVAMETPRENAAAIIPEPYLLSALIREKFSKPYRTLTP